MQPNQLNKENSLYLRQHANNPVAWHAWNETSLQKARTEKKPILLSIGYSACHWCHVMAHESFEEAETADLMNKYFINIKVDKEERPDLDKIYQTSLQLLTRRTGGWPLTMFLHYEDLSPFFGGTYFPDQPRLGMPSFKEVLVQVATYFEKEQAHINSQRSALKTALIELLAPPKSGDKITLNTSPIEVARHQLGGSYDPRFSGFGLAPKFPHPQNIERLFLHWHASLATKEDKGAYHMPLETLKTWARSGIFDQLGGGFFRYSVDEEWKIPHFEKMLYDNGLLLSNYAMAYDITKDSLYKETINHIASWLTKDLQHPEGAFYASMDADSEGAEGRYYIWSEKELTDTLTPDEMAILRDYYALHGTPNFEGAWHLHAPTDFVTCCENFNYDEKTALALLISAKQKLFAKRTTRVKPHHDEKIITSWNSLVAKGLIEAGRVTEQPELIAQGLAVLQFIYTHLWDGENLFALYYETGAQQLGYLDDYAFLLEALSAALQVSKNDQWQQWAIKLADKLLNSFEDKQNGGFYFTANEAEATLLIRPKPLMDEALPNGNAIATRALLRFGNLLGNNRYLEAAQRSLEYAFPAITEIPFAYNSFLNVLEEYLVRSLDGFRQ